MTVTTTDLVNNYRGNSSTTRFDFDFYIEDETQLKVLLTDKNGNQTVLSRNIDYTIIELKNKNGSYIIYPIQDSAHSVLSSMLTLPIEQTKEYANSSKLNLETLEYSFDYLTLLFQIYARTPYIFFSTVVK